MLSGVMKTYKRKLRDVAAGPDGLRRIDVTIPPAVMRLASLLPGDKVELRVTRSRRIILTPLRGSWPPKCSRKRKCSLAKGHDGACVVESNVPY